MKKNKKSLKKLSLNKNIISKLENEQISGGTGFTFACPTLFCPTRFNCPTQGPCPTLGIDCIKTLNADCVKSLRNCSLIGCN